MTTKINDFDWKFSHVIGPMWNQAGMGADDLAWLLIYGIIIINFLFFNTQNCKSL